MSHTRKPPTDPGASANPSTICLKEAELASIEARLGIISENISELQKMGSQPVQELMPRIHVLERETDQILVEVRGTNGNPGYKVRLDRIENLIMGMRKVWNVALSVIIGTGIAATLSFLWQMVSHIHSFANPGG